MEGKETQKIESGLAARNILTAEMTGSLPMPVQNWLKAIGAVGHEKIESVKLKQSGMMKLKPEQKKWTASEAEQISFTDPPAFRWSVRMKMGKGLVVTGKDSFLEGKADMRIKLAGILPISKSADNEKTNESSLQRYLMELAWYPSAALSPFISWQEAGVHSATATMNYGGLTGSATYFFDEHNELLKVEAWRYKENGEDARPLLCTGTINEHQQMAGLKVPVDMEISWELEEGTFTWYKFQAYDFQFNSVTDLPKNR